MTTLTRTLAISQLMKAEKIHCVWVLLLINLLQVCNGMQYIGKMHQGSSYDGRTLLEEHLFRLLGILKSEVKYGHLAMWRHKNHTANDNCLFEISSMRLVEEPIIIFDHKNEGNRLQNSISKRILILSCWPSSDGGVANFQSLKMNFPFAVGHLIWLDSDMELNNACSSLVDDFYSRLLVLNEHFLQVGTIHVCSSKMARQKRIVDSGRIFPSEAMALNGLVLVTESDQLPPRSILYIDANGKLQLEGFVSNCIRTFAERYNATLNITQPLQLGRGVYYDILLNKTSQGLLDVPAVVAPYGSDRFPNIYYSYPVELMDLCYMIPLPRLMEANRIYTYIVDIHVMMVLIVLFFIYGILFTIGTNKSARKLSMLDIVLNDKSIRVLLGQSFVMPVQPCLFMKYVCFLLCYTSLIISTTYEAYLQSNLIHPVLERRIETYEDIREAGLRIAITSQESDFLDSSTSIKYADIFQQLQTYDIFLKLRDSMDTRYVYPVSNTRWEVFSQQQRLFQRTLYYYSSHLCVKRQTLLGIPLRLDLPFKSLFDHHILDLRQTGLLQYWISDNFYTMIRLKYTTFKDLSTPEKLADAIELYDLKWIWTFYGLSLILAFVVFLVELVYFHKICISV